MGMFFKFCFGFLFWVGADMALADGTPPPEPPSKNNAPTADEIRAIREENERLKAENEGLKNKKKDPEPDSDDDDLRKKAKHQEQTAEDKARETKQIEEALQFNLGVDDFVKKNSDLLPKAVANIVALAHKEKYDSAISKAAAIKASVIQEYFAVQDNVDALTKNQKQTLDDYLKLTKTGKEDKAADIYANIFEPALETIRKIKKAEELGRSSAGFSSGTDADEKYKQMLMKRSREKYLGERTT